MRKAPITSLNVPEYQILSPQTGMTLSSASPSEISYSVKQGSVKGPNRSRGGSAGQNRQMKMCDVSATLPSSFLSLDSRADFIGERPLIDPSTGTPSPPPNSKSRKDLPYLWVNMRCYLKENWPKFRGKCSNIGPPHRVISEPVSVRSQF